MEIELIQRACEQDEGACQALVDQHRDAVFRLAYLLVGDAADAEDIAQETFIRAFRALDRFDTTRNLRPWLLQITANLARNRLRSISRYWSALKRFRFYYPDHSMPSVEFQNQQQAESHALWQAVRRLKTPEQEIIYLRYFLELSVNETAEALEIRSGTVKSRLHRALKQLRRVVEQDFPLLVEEWNPNHNG